MKRLDLHSSVVARFADRRIAVLAHWDKFVLTVTSLHDAGDHVIMQGRYNTGRNKATGKSMDAQACHVLRFKGGKLAGFQQYCDTAQLQTVMNR